MGKSRHLKMERAKLYGSLYFILCALFSAVLEITLNKFSLSDFIILVVASSPLLVNKKFVYLFFGMITGLLSTFLSIAMLIKFDHTVNSFPVLGFWIFLSLISISASASLIYAGLYCDDENRFSLI